ncbi:MAG TPA: cardiolipin synthase [Planctomycetota bacterium]|nr:cardiolipin synthase [Planctomycetota bacterium]
MHFLWEPPAALIAMHVVIIASVGLRVVMVRPVPSVALAWMFLVVMLPGIGLFAYLSFGERRLGARRARRLAELRRPYVQRLREILHHRSARVDWTRLPYSCEAMNHLGLAMAGVPTLAGNELQLLTDAEQVMRSMLVDLERAQHTVHMQFYIWHPGGTADEVVDAIVRAAGRGVSCNLLVDALGSARWLRGEQPERLRAANVRIVAAMPTGPWRALFRRNDLRNHRKIAVIDGEIAYTGSMNMVDPRFFHRGTGVGEWVDAMVRMRGPAVEALHGVLLSDWFLETGVSIEDLLGKGGMREGPRRGHADVQVLPSGPAGTGDALLQMLLLLFYAARRHIVVTTPYFVPDEAMLRAMRSAAARGVEVTLIVPARVDSLLVRHASRSYYDDLMAVGVQIQRYGGGLLHTKSVVIDDQITMFGTANLDVRSLWLNYEVSLFVYDTDFGKRVYALQQGYLRQCTPIDATAWRRRALPRRLVENLARLFSPLL